MLHDVEGSEERTDGRHIGAEIPEAIAAHGEEMTVLVQRQLAIEFLRSAMMVGQEGAGARVVPFHGTTQRARAMEGAEIFGEHGALEAEGAAHVDGDEADLLQRDLHHFSHIGLRAIHALRGRVEGEALVRRVIFGEAGARLHGVDDDAAVEQAQLRHMGRGFEGRLHGVAVAEVIVERHIAGDIIENLRGARLHRIAHFHDGGQRINLDHDGLGGVLRLAGGLRDHAGDGIAHIGHLAARQRIALGLDKGRAIAVGQGHAMGIDAVTGGLEIRRRVDGEHAGHGAGRAHIDVADHAMGLTGGDHGQIGLAGRVHIVRIGPLALHELGILVAQHRLANAEFQGRQVFVMGGKGHGCNPTRRKVCGQNKASCARIKCFRAQVSASDSSRAGSSRRTPSGVITMAFSRASLVIMRLTVSTVRPR